MRATVCRITCPCTQRPRKNKTPDKSQTLMRLVSTTITAMDEAIAAIDSRAPGENFTYQAIADQFGVNRTTLSRRHRGCQGFRRAEEINRRALSPQQELELCKYIEDLISQGLPPMRKIIQNFASHVAPEPGGEHRVIRFLHRNREHLLSNGQPVWTVTATRPTQNIVTTYTSTYCNRRLKNTT
jgi:AraC-like DNA-binding protein